MSKHPNELTKTISIGHAGFSRRAGAGTELLLLGTFSLGIPAIALTGGYYFSLALGGGQEMTIIGTLALLVLAFGVNFFGAKLSGNIQQILAYTLIVLLTLGFILSKHRETHQSLSQQ